MCALSVGIFVFSKLRYICRFLFYFYCPFILSSYIKFLNLAYFLAITVGQPTKCTFYDFELSLKLIKIFNWNNPFTSFSKIIYKIIILCKLRHLSLPQNLGRDTKDFLYMKMKTLCITCCWGTHLIRVIKSFHVANISCI